MSKLFNLNKKSNNYINLSNNKNTKFEYDINKIIGITKNNYKHFPVSIREWNNSIYSFNKNVLSSIPLSNKLSSKLIISYLKGQNFILRYKVTNARLTRKQKRLTCNIIHVSNGEFKHTNDKVIIVLYTYNRQKHNYLKLLRNRYFFNKKNINILNKKFYLIKANGLNYLKKININKYNIIKKIVKTDNLNNYIINFYKKWVKKSMRIIKTYLYIKQLLYINNSKYNYTYLQVLKNYIEKIYNKKVEFDLINIKYNYLNSDILLKSISMKITKNRRKHKLFISRPTWKIEIPKHSKIVDYQENDDTDINKPVIKKSNPNNDLKVIILNNIKHKLIGGIRLQVAGRLTRRITASKSIKKLKYRGNLINKESSLKGISSVMLKGNLRSNVQYTILKSKTRIGSFGAKGWVSGT